MRILEIDETKARIERLRFYHEAEDYGQDADPKLTAPFSIGTEIGGVGAAIFIDSTQVATFDLRDSPKLVLRDAYPTRFDGAILRAIRNAADVCDEIGKIKRAEAKEKGGSSGLFTKTPEIFQPRLQSADMLKKALIGATALNQKITFTWENASPTTPEGFLLWGNAGKTSHLHRVQVSQDGVFTYSGRQHQTYGLRAEEFNRLMDEGLKVFEARFEPQAFTTACEEIVAASQGFDVETITRAYAQTDRDEAAHVVSRFGLMSTRQIGYFTQHRYHGMLFSGGHDHIICTLYPDLDRHLVDATVHVMDCRMKAAVMGRTIEDFPMLSDALIQSRVEAVDCGYI